VRAITLNVNTTQIEVAHEHGAAAAHIVVVPVTVEPPPFGFVRETMTRIVWEALFDREVSIYGCVMWVCWGFMCKHEWCSMVTTIALATTTMALHTVMLPVTSLYYPVLISFFQVESRCVLIVTLVSCVLAVLWCGDCVDVVVEGAGAQCWLD
jgi:hypothetical protein